jgi:hypothetical protein
LLISESWLPEAGMSSLSRRRYDTASWSRVQRGQCHPVRIGAIEAALDALAVSVTKTCGALAHKPRLRSERG